MGSVGSGTVRQGSGPLNITEIQFGGRTSTYNPQTGQFGEFTRSSVEERNARELARVERENRQSGLIDRQQLRQGESYTFDWGRNDTRTGTYIGTRLINGTVVNEFRQSNGRIARVEDADLRRMNFRRTRQK